MPRMYSFSCQLPLMWICIRASIHVPTGVSAFHEAIASRNVPSVITSGPVTVPTVYEPPL